MVRPLMTDTVFLAQKALPADIGDIAVADDLLDTLKAHADGCVGMAANMIGVNKAIIVFDNDGTPCEMFNPVIVYRKGLYLAEEGCLSLPDIYEDVTRPARVRIAWTDLDGARREADFGGRWAVCAQHEMDHLDGRLFIDYLGSVRRALITARMKKLKREKSRG